MSPEATPVAGPGARDSSPGSVETRPRRPLASPFRSWLLRASLQGTGLRILSNGDRNNKDAVCRELPTSSELTGPQQPCEWAAA